MNLLVCRIQRGIARDRSVRTLLALVHPKVTKMARRIALPLGQNVDEVVVDIQALVYKGACDYLIGDYLHPLRWLFDFPNGAVHQWATKRKRFARKELQTTVHIDSAVDSEKAMRMAQHTPSEYDPQAHERLRAERFFRIIDDGVTLNAVEYRVVAFLVANADDGGLQRVLAERLKISRSAVTRIYGAAVRKLVIASGDTASYFAGRGLKVPRKRTRTNSLSADEVIDVVALRKMRRASFPDLAWLYNVSEYFLRRVVAKFIQMEPGQIRGALTR